jgi:hypothetical protein
MGLRLVIFSNACVWMCPSGIEITQTRIAEFADPAKVSQGPLESQFCFVRTG